MNSLREPLNWTQGFRLVARLFRVVHVGFEVRSHTGRFITAPVTELHGLADVGFRVVLDGELVSVGTDDNIDALGQRMVTRRGTRTVTLCVFDVLWLDGIDCTQLRYPDRRRVL